MHHQIPSNNATTTYTNDIMNIIISLPDSGVQLLHFRDDRRSSNYTAYSLRGSFDEKNDATTDVVVVKVVHNNNDDVYTVEDSIIIVFMFMFMLIMAIVMVLNSCKIFTRRKIQHEPQSSSKNEEN